MENLHDLSVCFICIHLEKKKLEEIGNTPAVLKINRVYATEYYKSVNMSEHDKSEKLIIGEVSKLRKNSRHSQTVSKQHLHILE